MVDVSIIGTGHLGSAVVRGLARDGSHTVTACDVSEEALAAVADAADRTTTALEDAATAEVVVLADLDLDADQVLLSFAAGVSIDFLEARTAATVVRGMPNLAAETNAMACAVAGPQHPEVESLLASLGEFVTIDEAQMDVATAVNGSGPAFVFYLIQALATAGEKSGLDPAAARTLAAQTFKGAAETVLRDDRELSTLIDAVSSEGGTTIEGMEVLWDSTVDQSIQAAVAAAEARSGEIAGENT